LRRSTEDAAEPLRKQRVGERSPYISRTMKRALRAEDPHLEAGVAYGRDTDLHHIAAAPRPLRQCEQPGERASQRDQVEAPIDRGPQHNVAACAKIFK